MLEFESNQLLSGNSENNIGLWNLNNINNQNNAEYYFSRHFLWVNSLVKYDDKYFVSASNDRKLYVWDYKERKFEFELGNHTDCILTLIKLKNGNLCSGGADNAIKVWDFEKKKCVFELNQDSWVKCICQIDDDTILFGSEDRTIKILKQFKSVDTIAGHNHSIRTICKIDNIHFASGSFDNKIKFWDIITKNNIYTLEGHSSNVICIIKTKDNKLVTCSSDKTMIIWD